MTGDPPVQHAAAVVHDGFRRLLRATDIKKIPDCCCALRFRNSGIKGSTTQTPAGREEMSGKKRVIKGSYRSIWQERQEGKVHQQGARRQPAEAPGGARQGGVRPQGGPAPAAGARPPAAPPQQGNARAPGNPPGADLALRQPEGRRRPLCGAM